MKWTATGSIQNLGTLTNHNSSRANAITNDGTVVGWSWYSDDFNPLPDIAFRWTSSGGMENLGTLGGNRSQAWAISDTGIIVGRAHTSSSGFRPCRFVPGGTNVQLPSEGTEGIAQGVSNDGVIVGAYGIGISPQPAMWIDDTLSTLALPAGHQFGWANAINSSHQVVGRSGSGAIGNRAVIWDGAGTPYDLNTLAALETGVTLTSAVAINERGQILCNGIVDGVSGTRVFVLHPLSIEMLDPVKGAGLIASGDITTNIDALGHAAAPQRIGMVCDGVTRLVLRLRGLPSDGQVTFQITDENGLTSHIGQLRSPGSVQGSSTLVTSVSTLTTGEKMAFAVLDAPEDFVRTQADNSLITRPINLDVTYAPQGGSIPIVAQLNVQLRRPPVMLLHGLNSNSDTWNYPAPNDIQNSTDPRFIVHTQDYRGSATESFTDNIKVPGKGISEAQAMMNDLGYACVQVDIVGHSMGGLLSRMYISGAYGELYLRPSNFNRGDVNRLITLDTPHLGSPIATVAMKIRDSIDTPVLGPLVMTGYLNLLEHALGCVTCGAVDDLRPDSFILTTLQGATVPAHAICAVGGSDILAIGGPWPGPTASLERVLNVFGYPLNEIFPPPLEHDAVVERASQEGLLGTGSPQTSILHYSTSPPPTNYALHFNNTSDLISVITITSLLNTPTTDANVFALGFPSASGGGIAPPPPPQYGPLVTGLSIQYPPNGITVQSGDELNVNVSAINGFQPAGVLIGAPFGVQLLPTAPYSTLIDIPQTALGDFKLQVMALDGDWAVAVLEPLTVHVELPAGVTLTGFDVRPNKLRLFEIDPNLQLTVYGVFSDGIERDITQPVFGTSYSIDDPQIAQVSADGIITSVGVGAATLTIGNGAVQTNVPVYVKSLPCPADVTDDAVVDVADMLAVIAAWGPCSVCPEDINQDGNVDVADLLAVISGWGPCY